MSFPGVLALVTACAAPEPPGELRAEFSPGRISARAGSPASVELRLINVGPGSAVAAAPLEVDAGLKVEAIEVPPAGEPASAAPAAPPPAPRLPERWTPAQRESVALDLMARLPALSRPGRYRVTWSHPSFSIPATVEVQVMEAIEAYATIKTNFGDIVLEFHPEDAPATVANFVKLAKKGFYDGLVFHRIIPGFMMQGGCPDGNGMGGPGYQIKAEFNKRKHVAGTVSMARSNHPDSAGSQFFICFDPASHLDGQYTAFAQVIKGLDVVKKIEPLGSRSGAPSQKVLMEKVIIGTTPP